MADKKISQLTALTGATTVAEDVLAIVDTSAVETKKIAVSELQAAPLSAGTANGITYLNASKVLTSGSVLTFNGTTLTNAGSTVLGNASTDSVTANGYMGVGGAPSTSQGIRINSTALTGTNQYGIVSAPVGSSAATSSIVALYGAVGSAAAAFTVASAFGLRVVDAAKGAGSTITNLYGLHVSDQTQGANNYGISSSITSGTNKWNIYASGTANNYFAGNVGVRTTSPDTALEIAGGLGNVATITASISGTTMDVTAVSVGTLVVGDLVYGANLQTGTKITALGTGTGGVGTYTVSVSQTAASGTVYSAPNGGSTNILRITSNDTGIQTNQPEGIIQFYGSDVSSPGAGVSAYIAAIAESTTPDTALIFGTRDATGGGVDANERMRITSLGNLLVGATSGSYKITCNGQPGANGYTAWTNYSDQRLKENVVPFASNPVLDKVCSLNPVSFNYNDKTGYDEDTRSRRISGFIAQELQQVFPEMVGTTKINDEEYLDTNLSNLNLYLLQALKELNTKFDAYVAAHP